MNEIHRSTPEARLVDAGWNPPAALRLAIERREALRAAVDRLRVYRADASQVVAALQDGDADDIRLAIAALATGTWLDLNCQRPDTDLTAWSATLEMRMIEAIYAAPEAVLATLAGHESAPDAAYVLGEARSAATPNASLVMFNGQPSRNRPSPPSMSKVMVSR